MSIGTRLFTWLNGDFVGADEFGNRYFRDKKEADPKKARRWVLYKGEPEASKVPPHWHRWLHYVTDEVPANLVTKPWQKPHVPNLTGTALAYRPPGHVLAGAQRDKATGDYEAWKP
jgi:NADH:ubiquinone oxidoreductase subunit